MPRGTVRIDITPPVKGMRTDMPRHLVEDGYFVDGENVIARDNVLRVRPGYFEMPGDEPFTGTYGLGGISYLDNENTRRNIASGTLALKEYTGGTWVDRTGSVPWGSSLVKQPRFALFQTNTESRVLITNNSGIPRIFTAGSNTSELTTTGSTPAPSRARDVTVAFQRAIFGNLILEGEYAPSSLIVSSANDPTTYPPLNRVDLSDTNDTIVAVRSLNSQQFAIYKDNSQWIGIGNTSRFPFTYELRSQATGPCSPSAVVVARGAHYYFGQDADLYFFDGTKTKSIGANIRRTLQSDVNFNYINKTWGFFSPIVNEVWWFYVSTSNTDGLYPDSAIAYNIETQAISSIHRFPAYFTGAIDYGYTSDVSWHTLTPYTWNNVASTYPAWASFGGVTDYYTILFDSDGNAHFFGGTAEDDNGTDIDAYVVSPTRNYTGAGEIARVDAIESYWKQTDTNRTLDIILVQTNNLATNGTEVKKQSFSLRDNERHYAEYHGAESRFIAIKQQILSAKANDEHRGLTLFLYDRKQGT